MTEAIRCPIIVEFDLNRSLPTGHRSYMTAFLTNLLRLSLFSAILLLTTSSACWAGLMKGDIVKLDRTATFGGSSGGGEFALHKLITSGSTETWLQLGAPTFCLEFNEHIVLGERLVVGAISDRAVLGGVSGSTGFGDPLSAQTQYLYAGYASGQLSSAVGYVSDNAWADSMQEAIWILEGEVSQATKAHTQTLLDHANLYAGPLLNNVFSLNLFKSNVPTAALSAFDPTNSATWGAVSAYHRQDQLFYVASPGTTGSGHVPEPASLAIWLVGSCCTGFSRRKRSTK